jgi:hypothetical protein
MRVAAGVILIIAAVINLFAALGYIASGAVVGGGSKFTSMVAEESAKQGRELTEEQKQQFAQINAASSKMSGSAGVLAGFGAFLFVTVGTSIAGAVCLFRRKAPKFILIASGIAIGAEILSAIIFAAVLGVPLGFGKLLVSAIGLLGGVFGIMGARQIMAASGPPAGGPPPVAAPM